MFQTYYPRCSLDLSIVKDGSPRRSYPSPHATWSEIQKSLAGGASVVMNYLEFRHQPLHSLVADLEEELCAFVSANSYLTPAGSMGFDPHYDTHDILVLQMEGTKTWMICEQRDVDLAKTGGGIFRQGDDLGNCTEYVFRPGDVFYAPMGTIHYAQANPLGDNPEQYSMHVTLSLNRQQFGWGNFIKDMAELSTGSFSAKISSRTSSSKALQKQLPLDTLRTIASSFDNPDLPQDFLTNLHRDLRGLVTTEFSSDPQTRSFLLQTPREPFEETVELIRHMMVMGRKKQLRQCPGSVGLSIDNFAEIEFRRLPKQRIMVLEVPGGYLVVTGKDSDSDEHLLPIDWKKGIEYALGSHTGSKAQFFTVKALMEEAGMGRTDAFKTIQELMNTCLLERRIEGSTEEKVCSMQ
jgi:hypothetical protein